MIGVTFSGRMGNQMLEYALARKLMHDRGDKDKFVFNLKHVEAFGAPYNGWEDSLKYAKVNRYKTDSTNLILKYGSMRQRLHYLSYLVSAHSPIGGGKSNLQHLLRLRLDGIYFNYREVPVSLCKAENIFTLGICENPLCFDDIKEILMDEFVPKTPLMEYNKELLRLIEDNNSVSVHVRRGDYLSAQYSGSYNICHESYFTQAIAEIKKRVGNPLFVFFSEDIPWAKATFGNMENTYFQSEKDSAWETMRLMNHCKHFIISNSTFSWWGQYLSRNEKKVVVSPDKWFADGDSNWPLIQDNFIKIKV